MTPPVAGRELDALVGKRVMGLPVPNGDIYKKRIFQDETHEWGIFTTVGSGAREWYWRGPSYSTDIAAAWEVVEKLWVEGEWGVVVNRRADPECGPDFYWVSVYVMGSNPNLSDVEAEAATAPHAICLLALQFSTRLL